VECYTQSAKVDERVALLGGSQVRLQPASVLIFNVKCMVSGGLETTNLSKHTKVNEK